MIVAIFGPDGTGKTTLAKMITRYLSSKGIKIAYIRFKSHHLAMYLMIRFLQKLSLIPLTNSPRILDYMLKRYFGRSRLYPYLELINGITWLFINVKVRKVLGVDVVVSERYIPDFLVSILIISPNKRLLNNLYRILKPFMQNTVKIFLYADVDDMLDRKKEEMLSRAYVYDLLRLYMYVAKIVGVDIYVNTSKHDKNEVFQVAKEFICNKVGKM